MRWIDSLFRHTACALLLAALAPSVHAAFITVNTLDDELNNDGDCSLREAVHAANTNVAVDACTAGQNTGGGLDTIILPQALADGEIRVSQIMVVTQALTIIGTHQHLKLTEADYRIFEVNMTNPAHGFQLMNLTLSGGWTQEPDMQLAGTAVRLRQAGDVKFSNVTFRDNTQSAVAHLGGEPGFGSVGSVTVEDCRFEDNKSMHTAPGGWGGAAIALRKVPQVTIRRTLFRANRHAANGNGGAVRLSEFDQASISDSIFRDNAAPIHGGGAIYVTGSIHWGNVLSVNRSTFVGNRGGQRGDIVVGHAARAHIANSTFDDTKGAVRAIQYGEVLIDLSTFIGNSSDKGFIVGQSNGQVVVRRSVLFGSPQFPLCTEFEGARFIPVATTASSRTIPVATCWQATRNSSTRA